MKGVGRELGRMAVGVGEPAELCRDIVGPDEGSFEDGGPVHELGHGSGSRAAWSAPLSVLGDATNHPVANFERDPQQVATGSTACGSREGVIGSGPTPRRIAQVMFD